MATSNDPQEAAGSGSGAVKVAATDYFRTRPEQVRPLEISEDSKHIPPGTLLDVLEKASLNHGDEPALRVERPLPPPEQLEGTWKTWTWKQYFTEAKLFASALKEECNFRKYDGVMIWGFNSPEWSVSFMGAAFAQGIPAGIYPTDSVDTVAYKTQHMGAKVAVVQNHTHVERYATIVDKVPTLTHLVVYDDATNVKPNEEIKRADSTVVKVLTFEEFLRKGSPDFVPETPRPEECACVVFTSGTTGLPKAVMLTHDNLTFEARSVPKLIPHFGEGQETLVSFLPLSHVGGLITDICAPACAAADFVGNSTVYYARPYDLKAGTLAHRLQHVHPTIFLAVPLVYERMMDKLETLTSKQPLVMRYALTWARSVALEYQRNMQLGGNEQIPYFYHLASVLLNKLKLKLGLDQCKLAFTAAAPISRRTLEFFASLSIPVHEAYGSSECTGICSMTTPGMHIWGSIGHALPGCEVKILNANGDAVQATRDMFRPTEQEQGELCCRGRNLMLGYMESMAASINEEVHEKEVEKTRKKNVETLVVTTDGVAFLRSGDKGCCDDRGMFRFTGRFKEQIKGLGGEIVAPVPLEDAIKFRAPAISKVIVVGNDKPYNVALITLQQEGATGEAPGNGKLTGKAAEVVPNCSTTEEAISNADWERYLVSAIEAVNADGSVCINRAHRIKKFTVLPRDFSLLGDEYTPTLKFKRSVIEEHFAGEIAKMYDSKVGDNEDRVVYVKTHEAGSKI